MSTPSSSNWSWEPAFRRLTPSSYKLIRSVFRDRGEINRDAANFETWWICAVLFPYNPKVMQLREIVADKLGFTPQLWGERPQRLIHPPARRLGPHIASARSAHSAPPAPPAQAFQPVLPVQPTTPSQPTLPVPSTHPVEPTNLVQSTPPVDPTPPAEPTTLIQPTSPVKQTPLVQPCTPGSGIEHVGSDHSVDEDPYSPTMDSNMDVSVDQPISQDPGADQNTAQDVGTDQNTATDGDTVQPDPFSMAFGSLPLAPGPITHQQFLRVFDHSMMDYHPTRPMPLLSETPDSVPSSPFINSLPPLPITQSLESQANNGDIDTDFPAGDFADLEATQRPLRPLGSRLLGVAEEIEAMFATAQTERGAPPGKLISALATRVDTLEESDRKLVQQCNELAHGGNRIDKLETRVSVCDNNMSIIQTDLSNVRGELAKANAVVTELQTNVSGTNNSMEQIKGYLNTLEDFVDKAGTKLAEAKSDVQGLEQDNRNLRLELTDTQDRVTKLEEALSSTDAKLAHTRQYLTGLAQALKSKGVI